MGGEKLRSTLEYRTPRIRPPANRAVYVAAGIALSIELGINVAMLLYANSDRSWAALGVAFGIGPIYNAVLAGLSAICIPAVRRASNGTQVWPYVAISTVTPLVMTAINAICVLAMPLHGC